MFGSTEISKKHICDAKFSGEFKYEIKIGGNCWKKVMAMFQKGTV